MAGESFRLHKWGYPFMREYNTGGCDMQPPVFAYGQVVALR